MRRMTCQTSSTSSPPCQAPSPGPPPAGALRCPRGGIRTLRTPRVLGTLTRWRRGGPAPGSSAWLMTTCSLWTGCQVFISLCSAEAVSSPTALAERSPAALSPSDEDREEADSEPDEGIHIPGKFRQNKPLEVSRSRNDIWLMVMLQVAASLPVGIPWPAQLTARAGDRQRAPVLRGQISEAGGTGDSERPSDIAASIQVSHRRAFKVFTRSKQRLIKHYQLTGFGKKCPHKLYFRRQCIWRFTSSQSEYLQQRLTCDGMLHMAQGKGVSRA